MLTRAGICVPPTVAYLPYCISGSTLTAVGRSQLQVRWPGTHSQILSGIQRAAQTVLSIYLKRSCSRVTSASSALWVLNDYALYKDQQVVGRSLPGRPGRPRWPGSPGSPPSPGGPANPDSPWGPGLPIRPGSPGDPDSPVNPNTHTHTHTHTHTRRSTN